MRVSKNSLIVCWIITVVSFGAIVILHEHLDIQIQKVITQTNWVYDFDERDFYQSIWSNVFTGAIVSLMITYVSYFHEKHKIEFELISSETMLTLKFGLLASSMYAIDLEHQQNNHAAIARFVNQITETREQYNRMIQANNDYTPFLKSKKCKTLKDGKLLIQEIWLSVCGVEDDLITYEKEILLKDVIDQTREKTAIYQEQLKKLYETLKTY